jgi:superfamily I DNA/RNA helicase
LENSFAEKGIPVFVPSNDDSGIVDNLAASKVVFSTYHQAKGLERKVVVVFGFNADYFKYFAKESDPLRCPVRTVNTTVCMYVCMYVCKFDCLFVCFCVSLGNDVCGSN